MFSFLSFLLLNLCFVPLRFELLFLYASKKLQIWVGKRAFKCNLFTELQFIIFKTNQLFHHLHNCISRLTQIIWTKCSIHSVGTVVKVDSPKNNLESHLCNMSVLCSLAISHVRETDGWHCFFNVSHSTSQSFFLFLWSLAALPPFLAGLEELSLKPNSQKY